MNKHQDLFAASEESDIELELKTNKEYAKSYNKFRQKELLKKLKDRQALCEPESSSETDSSDEEDVVDSTFDQEFFTTLASIKSCNPAIYDKNVQFFDEFNKKLEKNQFEEKSSKPITLKDYERQILLENKGNFEEGSDTKLQNNQRYSPTFVEEEHNLKEEFKKIIDANDSEEEDFGGIFNKRIKTKQEQENEDEEFLKWLSGERENVSSNVKEKLEPLKKFWTDPKLPQRERFLRDYVLNKGYAEANLDDIPTYEEIIGETQLSEDELELEKQEEFEYKYNFRFEEPDSEFIKRYPRTIESSVRQSDDKRKVKRNEIKERKQQEKQEKIREFEIVKEMKRQEIEEKIRKLKAVTGNDDIDFKEEELENDFDPKEHDKIMQEMFNDEFYKIDEKEKPECPSDIEDLRFEDYDNYNPSFDTENAVVDEAHCEDEEFNMDCDYEPTMSKEAFQHELINNTKRRKTRKGRRNRFMEMLQTVKPVFNPEDEKTYAEYIEEYYKLDCEDVIDDIPCRFKYVETTPNDFGLTIEEILLAKNKELNQWASLKKAIQIRPDNVEKKEQRLYKMKAKNEQLKRKIFKSLYGESSDENSDSEELRLKNKTNKPNQSNTVINKKIICEKMQVQKQKADAGNSSLRKEPKQNMAKEETLNQLITPQNNKNNKGIEKQNSKNKPSKEIGVFNNKKTSSLNRNYNASSNTPTKSLKNTKNRATLKEKPKNSDSIFEEIKITDERLKAYGINPKKFHKKQKYKKTSQ